MTMSDTEFERGARTAIEHFKGYFQDESERAIHADLPNSLLDSHAENALSSVLWEESNRPGRGTPDRDSEPDLLARIQAVVMMADVDITAGDRPHATDAQYRAIAQRLLDKVVAPERLAAAVLGSGGVA